MKNVWILRYETYGCGETFSDDVLGIYPSKEKGEEAKKRYMQTKSYKDDEDCSYMNTNLEVYPVTFDYDLWTLF